MDPFDLMATSLMTSALARSDVAIYPGGAVSPTIIDAVFDLHSFVDEGFSGELPSITAQSDVVAGLGDGDTVTVGDAQYRFRHSKASGRGLTTCFLMEA